MDQNRAIITEKVIHAVLTVEILFGSVCALTEVEFLKEPALGESYTLKLQCVLVLIMALYIVSEVSAKKMLTLIFTMSGTGLFILYFLMHRQQLKEGGKAVYNVYIEFWNNYYKTSYGEYICETDSLIMTLAFVILLMFFICMMIRRLTGIRFILLLPPLIVIFLGLLVYKLPDWKGLSFFFTGVILLYSEAWEKKSVRFCSGGKNIKERFVPTVLFVLIFGIGATIAVGELCAEVSMLIPENSSTFIAFEERLENNIQNLEPLSFRKTKTVIDNTAPDFSDKKILTISAAEKPESNLYLASYYSSVYESGEWQSEENRFKIAVKNAGYDADELLETLWMEMYEKVYQDEGNLAYSISYHTLGLKNALVPCFSNISGNGSLWIEEEGVVKKNRFVQYLSVEGLSTNSDSYSYWKLTDLDSEISAKYEDEITWYEGYIMEGNQAGKKDLSSVKEYAKKVMTALGGSSWYYGEISDEAIENIQRLKYAGKVRELLESSASYNLYLDELPEGEDATEYFLGTSHKGYCMHFASAGVLILQELGVPARYASGYVVKESSFSKSKDGYEATVSDRNGHAWVEIYLNGVGWVPYEMTPGYSDTTTLMPTTKENQEKLRKEYEYAEISNVPESEDIVLEKTKEVARVEESVKEGENDKEIGWILGIIALIMLMVIVIAAVYIGPKIQNSKRIKSSAFRKKHGRETVILINQTIYAHLKKMETKTDAQYLKNLIEVYPEIGGDDWERFLEIVQKASFSEENISQEEAEFCFKIYLRYKS